MLRKRPHYFCHHLFAACCEVLSNFESRVKVQDVQKLTDNENYKCQKFGWSLKKRFEFLKLLNDTEKYQVPEDLLQQLAKDSSDQAATIRDMVAALVCLNWGEVRLRPAASTRDEDENIAGEYTCSSCGIMYSSLL